MILARNCLAKVKEDCGASADDNLQVNEYLLGLKGLSGPTVENQPSSCSSPDHLVMKIMMIIITTMTIMMVMMAEMLMV